MWRSRLRATFLSNRDEVDAGDELTITHKTGYDIYRLLGVCAYSLHSYLLKYFITIRIFHASLFSFSWVKFTFDFLAYKQ